MNPKIHVSEQFWRVCGASRGLRTFLRLTGTQMHLECSSVGRVLHASIYGEPPSQVSFPKSPNVPPRNKERDGGSTNSGSIVVNTLQKHLVFDWLCCQLGRSFSNHSLASSGLSGCPVTDALRSRTKFRDRRKIRPCSAVVVLVQQPFSSNPNYHWTSNGGVRTCIAGVRVLKNIDSFEGSDGQDSWVACGRSVGGPLASSLLGHQLFQVEVPFGFNCPKFIQIIDVLRN